MQCHYLPSEQSPPSTVHRARASGSISAICLHLLPYAYYRPTSLLQTLQHPHTPDPNLDPPRSLSNRVGLGSTGNGPEAEGETKQRSPDIAEGEIKAAVEGEAKAANCKV